MLAARSGTCKIENILDKTCEEMQQTINQSLQNNLNKLEKDCKRVDERIGELLTIDEKARAKNRRAAYYGWIAFFASLLAPLVLLLLLLHRSGIVLTLVELLPGAIPTEVTTPIVAAFGQTCDALVAPEASTTAVAAAGSSDGSGGSGVVVEACSTCSSCSRVRGILRGPADCVAALPEVRAGVNREGAEQPAGHEAARPLVVEAEEDAVQDLS